jgi:hypothetical protein
VPYGLPRLRRSSGSIFADAGKTDLRQRPDQANVVAQLGRNDRGARGLASESQPLHGFARGLQQPIALADSYPATDYHHARVEDVDDRHERGSERAPGVIHDPRGGRVAGIFECRDLGRTDLAQALLADQQLDAARRELLAVLEQAPGYERAQALLLTVHARRSGP